ncbi:hypothetical protein ES703_67475 [subsurface metagenome]
MTIETNSILEDFTTTNVADYLTFHWGRELGVPQPDEHISLYKELLRTEVNDIRAAMRRFPLGAWEWVEKNSATHSRAPGCFRQRGQTYDDGTFIYPHFDGTPSMRDADCLVRHDLHKLYLRKDEPEEETARCVATGSDFLDELYEALDYIRRERTNSAERIVENGVRTEQPDTSDGLPGWKGDTATLPKVRVQWRYESKIAAAAASNEDRVWHDGPSCGGFNSTLVMLVTDGFVYAVSGRGTSYVQMCYRRDTGVTVAAQPRWRIHPDDLAQLEEMLGPLAATWQAWDERSADAEPS